MAGIQDIISGAAQRHGVDPSYMLRTAQIESGLNPAARNASGASGLYQFVPSTARQYGLADPMDAEASADAAARLAADNAAVLRKSLGRDPTPGELYLAHQQGAGGASGLLSDPNALAADVVGANAVTQNGGRPGMTAGEFANLWTGKFGGTPPAGGRAMSMPAGTNDAPTAPFGLTPTAQPAAQSEQPQDDAATMKALQALIAQQQQPEPATRQAAPPALAPFGAPRPVPFDKARLAALLSGRAG